MKQYGDIGQMTMTASEYQVAAARTMNIPNGFALNNLELSLVWNVVGLAGEVGELVDAITSSPNPILGNVKKEAGDVMWYIAALLTSLEEDFSEMVRYYMPTGGYTRIQIGCRLASSAGKATELIKKGVFHQHGVNKNGLLESLFDVYCLVVDVCEVEFGISIEEIWQFNIAKLYLRYPDGFKSEDSIKRVDVGGVQ